MYADDTFLLCKAESLEVFKVKECLDLYCSWSGQQLNSNKSALVFTNSTKEDARTEITNLLGFRLLSRDDKFLGCPLLFSKSKSRDFNYVLENIKARLSGWRSRLLSQAGRTTLIKSVISSIPVYTMSTFLLPKSICEAMDSVVRKFWWVGSSDKTHFLTRTNWDSLCNPRSYGGLGFKKFRTFNFALVSKLG
uniref:Reverse transcriptase n=1 Tax=Cannabis sativa TaxID=3483 RepID=A0A803PIZ4_CANSA